MWYYQIVQENTIIQSFSNFLRFLSNQHCHIFLSVYMDSPAIGIWIFMANPLLHIHSSDTFSDVN